MTTLQPLIGDVLNRAADRMNAADLYFGHGTDNAWDEACLLLFEVLQLPPDSDESIAAEHFPAEALGRFEALVSRRISERVPAAYLIGKAWYGGYAFNVTADVLVPRSPLAELIDAGFAPWYRGAPRAILDLCAGSGCLGILCGHRFPAAEVTLAELSPAAAEVARSNIALHDLAERVKLYEGDLFVPVPVQKFDVILSNPPYVDAEDMASLPAEFHHEPALGLGSGRDGLDITRRILTQAADWLSPDGILLVEVGNSWPALEAAYPNIPFTWIELERGGQGIFLLSAAELRQFSKSLQGAYNRGAD